MPNTRRRRFSVQNDIAGRDTFKLQRSLQKSKSELNTETSKEQAGKNDTSNSSKTKSKTYPNTSQDISPLDIVVENESSSSISTVKMLATTNNNVDKTVTASSSSIDSLSILNATDNSSVQSDATMQHEMQSKNTDSKLNSITNRDRTPRREKYGRQHRVKVRSPRRRVLALDTHNKVTEIHTRAIGINPVDWSVIDRPEMDKTDYIGIDRVSTVSVLDLTETMPVEDERPPEESSHSMEDMCRICHSGESLSTDLGQLIAACSCRGTVGRVHVKCLERWLTESGKSRCELCGTRYSTKRVHRYGVARALVMWILSQNAKQLMVDILGIMLMSPLAVLAAWLSGRTLAGLMIQESHVTPWPLASTFVLACMTLVCYYCWIVSAATRHALGWWIWYRSQYEVRLQLQDNED